MTTRPTARLTTTSAAVSRTWSPILEGTVAARADAAITAVAEAVTGVSLPPRHTSAPLAAGEAGIALFYAYLDRARPGAGHGETAEGWLDRAFDVLASSAQNPSLFGGFTGVAWVAEHLREPEMEKDAEADDPNADIDAALLQYLRQTPWRYHYDLTAGLVGYAVYALERLPRPSAVTSLELVVEHLAEIAQARPRASPGIPPWSSCRSRTAPGTLRATTTSGSPTARPESSRCSPGSAPPASPSSGRARC